MKFFGLGYPRTGTTSLARAMGILGYKWIDGASGAYEEIKKTDYAGDSIIPILFMDLDKKWPNSKFIYLIRDVNSWLNSCERHFHKKYPTNSKNMTSRRIMFGNPYFSREHFKKVYERHDKIVREYFKDRPNDLLIMKISDGWEKLCPFVEKPIPNQPFPYKRGH